jgi:hypothetical protein
MPTVPVIEQFEPPSFTVRSNKGHFSVAQSFKTRRLLRTIAFFIVLVSVSIVASRADAVLQPATPCTKELRSFVEAIDELLSKNVLADEPFYAAIREHLPGKGCTVEEVISISRTSKFFAPPFELYASYTVSFKNADVRVVFSLEKSTGNIGYPAILSMHRPSW